MAADGREVPVDTDFAGEGSSFPTREVVFLLLRV
jgi:hypothetical protein